MAPRPRSEQRIQLFITELHTALQAEEANGEKPPVVRRKLRTVVNRCGYDNVRASFLDSLQKELNGTGIYTEPPLTQANLDHDDFVHFSTGPFPPDALFFPKESQLKEFVKSCLGTGRFRNLRLYEDNRRNGWEFPVDGGRVDLLCEEERRRGKGPLVAIELKRGESAREAVVQLVGYLEKLSQMFPDRKVNGLIISGREDKVGIAVLGEFKKFEIEWWCYKVEFTRVSEA